MVFAIYLSICYIIMCITITIYYYLVIFASDFQRQVWESSRDENTSPRTINLPKNVVEATRIHLHKQYIGINFMVQSSQTSFNVFWLMRAKRNTDE